VCLIFNRKSNLSKVEKELKSINPIHEKVIGGIIFVIVIFAMSSLGFNLKKYEGNLLHIVLALIVTSGLSIFINNLISELRRVKSGNN